MPASRRRFGSLATVLIPTPLSRALELEPSLACAKGEEIPAGRIGRARRQRTGVCSLSTEKVVNSTSLERLLVHLRSASLSQRPRHFAARAAENLRADFFCYWLSATGHGGL